jgi:hypothetical protein
VVDALLTVDWRHHKPAEPQCGLSIHRLPATQRSVIALKRISQQPALLLNYVAETDVKCGTMEATIRKVSVGAMVLALLMLLFGSLMFLFGYFALSEWRSERAALIGCGVVWILTGPAVFGSALWLLGSLGRNLLALRIGGSAIVASGTVLVTAAAAGVLQCSGPA